MPLATLLAVAEKPPPMIDIDATVFVQFLVFVTMAAVLNKLVFRPYLHLREERGRRIDGARDEARRMQERARALLADYEEKITRAKQRGGEERLKLRAEARAYEQEVLGRAREAGQAGLEEARKAARAQREIARTRLLVESSQIARRIASRILGRELA